MILPFCVTSARYVRRGFLARDAQRTTAPHRQPCLLEHLPLAGRPPATTDFPFLSNGPLQTSSDQESKTRPVEDAPHYGLGQGRTARSGDGFHRERRQHWHLAAAAVAPSVVPVTVRSPPMSEAARPGCRSHSSFRADSALAKRAAIPSHSRAHHRRLSPPWPLENVRRPHQGTFLAVSRAALKISSRPGLAAHPGAAESSFSTVSVTSNPSAR